MHKTYRYVLILLLIFVVIVKGCRSGKTINPSTLEAKKEAKKAGETPAEKAKRLAQEKEAERQARVECLKKEVKKESDLDCFSEKKVAKSTINNCLEKEEIRQALTYVKNNIQILERKRGGAKTAIHGSYKKIKKYLSIFLLEKELDLDCFENQSEAIKKNVESIRSPLKEKNFVEARDKAHKIVLRYGDFSRDNELKPDQQARYESFKRMYELFKDIAPKKHK